MSGQDLWARYKECLWFDEGLGLRVDYSRMLFPDSYLDSMAQPTAKAVEAMAAIEAGAIANTSENRRVGHYWLRTPDLAPQPAIRDEIQSTSEQIREFARRVHEGEIRPQRGDAFYIVLVIGIGGSALGPQFISDALGSADDAMAPLFLDNTDPDGIDRVLAEIDESLDETLTIVISKSGGTKETRNAMLEVTAAYKRAGLSFAQHAVAVTAAGSELHKKAVGEKWLATFPMWDWVGGRTSVTSAVGLLPAALQGLDINALLRGARECDERTRNPQLRSNPAALLACMWRHAGSGRGDRDMVVIPYKDRLVLFSRYLQQLVMESLGKSHDRDGREVKQGLTVYGNKGSTDQHAFVQQLRDGRDDFFLTFINVLRDRNGPSIQVEADLTCGDYLWGFCLGTREALFANHRESITITLDRVDAFRTGALIALFERAVGIYAELINVNAYDQPGVEAGKQSAAAILELQRRVLACLRSRPGDAQTAEQIAAAVEATDRIEDIFHLLEHAAANPDHEVGRHTGPTATLARFSAEMR